MTKSLRALLLLGVLPALHTGPACARRPASAATQYRWERMSVTQVLPSQVFARLGLTHSTRYGFTRDGFTKKTPDPTFPAGLTDVVPYDTTHVLLVRGTPQGLAQFRARVLATESMIVSSGRWHVTVELRMGADGDAVGTPFPEDVMSDRPFVVAVGDPAGPRLYRLSIHVNADATTVVSCQPALTPAPTAETRVLLTPVQVWAPAITRPLLPGGTLVFDDRAADREDARRRLSLPPEAAGQDFQLQVTVEAPNLPPVVPETALPTPVDPEPTSGPSPSTEEIIAPRS